MPKKTGNTRVGAMEKGGGDFEANWKKFDTLGWIWINELFWSGKNVT
jgi:hypothetical protein